MEHGDAQGVWQAGAAVLQAEVTEAQWRSSLSTLAPVECDQGRFLLAAPNPFVKDRIEARYMGMLRSALQHVSGTDLEPVITVDPGAASLPAADPVTTAGAQAGGLLDRLANEAGVDVPRAETPEGHATAEPLGRDRINPKYTFDAFVNGASNRFARAASLSVAETPGRSYNPLFVYGHSGLGKTHLLLAIANYVTVNYPDYRVRYVSTETFLNEFVNAIRTNSPITFKQRYRDIDVLLVDDIQFMEGKEGLQEEFFHTFETLYEANRQIVLSSDRPPDAISTLEDRLRSRFKMGLITDIQPPDFETRLAILRKKAEREPAWIPESVLAYIAEHIRDNIRELEGALNRISAFATLNNEELDEEKARRVLSDLITDQEPRAIATDDILEATARMFDFDVADIIGRDRRRPLVTARHVAMYVTRELTELSFPAIGKDFGGRDHTTVMNAVSKIQALMKERRQIYNQVTELVQAIKVGG